MWILRGSDDDAPFLFRLRPGTIKTIGSGFKAPQGVAVSPLITTPTGRPSWGETDLEGADDKAPAYNPPKPGDPPHTGDVPGPVTVAAAANYLVGTPNAATVNIANGP